MKVLARQHCRIRAAVLLALVVAANDAPAAGTPGAKAGDAASRGWTCSLCPVPDGWSGELDAGVGWVSDSSPKFGDYRGLDRQGSFAALDGSGRYGDSQGRFLAVEARDLGIDSRSLGLRGGVRGRYEFVFAYREIPKYRGFGAETVYRGVGGDRLTLPGDWQAAASTGEMVRLAESLQPAALELTRKTLDFGLRGRIGSRWDWNLALEHQRKEGTRPFGAGVFTVHSSHFPAPVDFSTSRLAAGLSFAGDQANWRLGVSGSAFDNGFASVAWPNPFTPLPGTERLRASLEPDNRYYQFEFAGAWAPLPRLRLTGVAAVGRMEQDDPLLPATSNPDFSEVAVPRATAETRIDTGTINLGGTADLRLSPRFTLTARLRRDERDNRTPVDTFTPIITDIAPREPRPNRPYSFERDRASMSLRYRAHPAIRLQAGADFEDYERSLQSVLETEESSYWGEAALTPGDRLELRVRLERSDRDAGPYRQLQDGGPIEHPLMRKFHLADREREGARIDLDLYLLPELTLSLGYRYDQDEFSRSGIGLQEAGQRALTLDLGWSVGERLQIHAFAGHEEIDSSMASAASPTAEPWTGATRDRFLTAGAGLAFSPDARFSIGFDLVRAESKGDIRIVSGNSGGAFPTLHTDLWNARLYADYALNERWGVKAWLEYESWDSSDWALDGLGPDGIPAILAFGQDSPDYDVVVLRLQASYRF